MYTNEIFDDEYSYNWVRENYDNLEEHKYLVMWSTRFEPCEAVGYLNAIFSEEFELKNLSRNQIQNCLVNSKKIASFFLQERRERSKQLMLQKDFSDYFNRFFISSRGWNTVLIQIIGESRCRLTTREFELKRTKISISNTGSVEYFSPIMLNNNWIEKRNHYIDKIAFEYESLKKEIHIENSMFEVGIRGCQQILD